MSELINMKLAAIAASVAEWSNRNFPNNKPHHPLLGMVEEWGECVCARRGAFSTSTEPEISAFMDEMRDAFGDILIYAADYAGRNDLQLRFVPGCTSREKPIHELLAGLAHFHLKLEQGIRYPAHEAKAQKQAKLDEVVAGIAYICDGTVDPWLQLERTWEKVKQRDWVKKPIGAATGSEK